MGQGDGMGTRLYGALADVPAGGGRLEQLLMDVAIAANEATSIHAVFEYALHAVADVTGWKVGHAFVRSTTDPDSSPELILGPADATFEVIRRATVEGGFDPNTGLTGRVFASGVAEWIEDVRQDPRFIRNDLVGELNVGAGIAFPVRAQNDVVAVMEFFAAHAETPDRRLLETMTVIGTQLGRVVEREMGRKLLIDRDAKLLAAQRIAGIGYWEWNLVTMRLHWTEQLYKLYGLDPADGIDYNRFIAAIHDDDRADMIAVIEAAMNEHQPYYHVHRAVHADGTVRYIQGHGEVQTDRQGRAVKMNGTGLDVTTLKQTEIELRQLEERTRALTDSAVEAIVTIDERGAIVGWNDSAARVFGYDRNEVEGRSLKLMMPDRYHDAHSEGLRRAAATGEQRLIGKTIQIEARRKSGEEFPIELSLSTWQVAGETFFGGIIRDVSVRKRVEKELVDKTDLLRRLAARLQKVREEERTKLSREVHDLLGQSLTGLRMDVAMIEKLVGTDADEVRDRLQLMKGAIDETVHVVRRISSDLRPGVLDDLGIHAALEWDLVKFEHRTGIRCSFDDLTDGITLLDSNQSTAVFRVFQELLTNVARHAQADVVRVSIEDDDGTFRLTVEDDGIGIGPSKSALTRSLGVLGMRERLAPWGGEIEFQGAPGRGTRVVVSLPLRSEQSTEE